MTSLAIYTLLLSALLLAPLSQSKRPSSAPSETPDVATDFDDLIKQTTVHADADRQRPKGPSDYLSVPVARGASVRNVTDGKGRNTILTTVLKSADILNNYYYYHNETSNRSYSGEVLAYVTPWNRKGYGMAKILAPKLTWLSPVWFQLRREPLAAGAVASSKQAVDIGGEHEVDSAWLEQVRQAHAGAAGECGAREETATCPAAPPMYIVPRVTLETDIKRKDDITIAVDKLLSLRSKYGFDGFTLELSPNAYDITRELPERLKAEDPTIKIVFVVPPIEVPREDPQGLLEFKKSFLELAAHVDRFSVMTYDRSKFTGESSNAPYDWVKEIVSNLVAVDNSVAGKLLMGLPMYGWRGADAMIADTMVVWLAEGQLYPETSRVLVKWLMREREHVFVERLRGRTSSYPTPAFLYKRLQLAEEQRVAGVALWELGQMMPYLVDMF